MLGFIIIVALLISFAWIAHEINTFPENKHEDYEYDYDDDDPTTTIWHDDDHYPDSKI